MLYICFVPPSPLAFPCPLARHDATSARHDAASYISTHEHDVSERGRQPQHRGHDTNGASDCKAHVLVLFCMSVFCFVLRQDRILVYVVMYMSVWGGGMRARLLQAGHDSQLVESAARAQQIASAQGEHNRSVLQPTPTHAVGPLQMEGITDNSPVRP